VLILTFSKLQGRRVREESNSLIFVQLNGPVLVTVLDLKLGFSMAVTFAGELWKFDKI
jgi:hypothetical protein